MTELNRCSRQRVRARLPESKRLTQLGCTRATTKHTNQYAVVRYLTALAVTRHFTCTLRSTVALLAGPGGAVWLHFEPRPPQVRTPRSTPYSTHLDPSMHRYPPTLGLRCSHLFTSPSAVRPGVIAVSQTVRSKLLDGYGIPLDAERTIHFHSPRLRYTSGRREDDPLPQPVTPPWA